MSDNPNETEAASPPPLSPSALRWWGIVVAVVGLVLLVVGIIYFAVPAAHLPSIMGRLPKATGHRSYRATGGVVVGLICLAIAAALFIRARILARRAAA